MSKIDGQTYDVLKTYADNEEAANRLAKVNTTVIKVLDHIKEKYIINRYDDTDEKKESRRHEIAERILRNYNFEVISENDPFANDGTTYTVDKGAKLKFCVRDKINGKLHSIDILTFVGLHELAHIGNPTWGHGEDFWEVFKFILREAVEAGLYTPIDYASKPVIYCGLLVDHNPLLDPLIKDI